MYKKYRLKLRHFPMSKRKLHRFKDYKVLLKRFLLKHKNHARRARRIRGIGYTLDNDIL
jgi:hypothetical protein